MFYSQAEKQNHLVDDSEFRCKSISCSYCVHVMGLHQRPLVPYKLQYYIPGMTKKLIFQKARIILDI